MDEGEDRLTGGTRMRRKRVYRGLLRLVAVTVLFGIAVGALTFSYRKFCQTVYPQEYCEWIEQYSQEYGVDEALVYAVVKVESDFRPDVVSVNDACGLMQLLPETFQWLQTLNPGEEDYGREDLFQPEVNLRYGVFFLSWLLKQFEEIPTAVAAYHAGAGAVEKWLSQKEYSADGQTLVKIPYPDTAHYVEQITECYAVYQSLYAK